MEVTSQEYGRSRGGVVLLAALVCTLIVVLATSPENTGDAVDYARDAAGAPSVMTLSLYEPGHLFWRPTGVLLREAIGSPSTKDPAAIRDTQRRFSRISVVASVVVSAAIGLLVLGGVGSLAAALAAVVMTALGASIINFGQAGAPYIPGLALVCLALLLGTGGGQRPSLPRAIVAGCLLAAGVLLWLPFVLVVPAVLVAALLSPGETRYRVRATIAATMACGLIGVSVYLGIASLRGVRSPLAFMQWIGASAHGIARPGLSRVIIGLPRSFVHMGNDGREVRRYLLADPLNPVTSAQVATLHLWPKLVLFYLVLAVVARFALRRPQGRKLLLALGVAVVPVVWLGAAWSGGEEERYLALYPFIIPLVIWAAWTAAAERQRLVPAAVGALALLWLSNVIAFNPWATRARSAAAQARLGCVAPILDARSVIIVPHQSDPLVTFTRDRLDERPRSVGTSVNYLLPPNTIRGLSWNATLDSLVARALGSGGRVWIPAYALDSIPPRSSGWVEGGQAVKWSQIREAFSALGVTRGCSDTPLLEVVAR